MIDTDELVQELRLGVKRVLDAQLAAARKNIYALKEKGRPRRTGRLEQMLSGASANVGASAGAVVALSEVPLYQRFLDMREHGNRQVYNRPLYGVLYGDTLRRVKHRIYEMLQTLPERGGWADNPAKSPKSPKSRPLGYRLH